MTCNMGKIQLQQRYCPISQEVKTNNQTMKLGQLVEHKMRNIFLEKSYTKCDGEIIPRLFNKKSKLSISVVKSFIQFVFTVFQVKG